MPKPMKASRRRAPKLMAPWVRILSAAKRPAYKTKEVTEYPSRFDDIKHLFLSKREFLQIKAALRQLIRMGGGR